MQTENIIYQRQLAHNIVNDALLEIATPVHVEGNRVNIAVTGKTLTSPHLIENSSVYLQPLLISMTNQYGGYGAITASGNNRAHKKRMPGRLLAQNPDDKIEHLNGAITPGVEAKK